MRTLAGGRPRALPPLAFLLGLGLSATGLSAQDQYRVQGRDVAIYNLAGSAEVVPGSGSDVVVDVMRGGSDAGNLQVDIREVDGHQALVIRYPDDRIVYPEMGRGSRTEIRVKEDGTFSRGSSNTDQVRISGSGDGMEAWADLRISVPRGTEFSLFLAVGKTDMRDVEGNLFVDTGSGAIDVRGGRGELNLDTGSGAVTLNGFQGPVTIDTGSGSVELNDVQGDEIMVDTGSGSVQGARLSAGSVGVDTGSGSIRLRGLACPDVSLDTGSGEVDVELLEDVDNLVVDTGSGAVTIRAPSSLGAEVELDTGSGGIDLDLPLEVRQVKRDYLRGILGDGRGSIRVETGSGGIRLIGG